jgi:4-hydroxyphenylpyruvate dioxygenase
VSATLYFAHLISYSQPSGEILGFDHVLFWVNNAMQAAVFYCSRFGFEVVAYRGLETGSRNYASYVLRQNQTFFVLTSPLGNQDKEFNDHLTTHGDGVRDVAFTVDDARVCYAEAMKRGAKSVQEPIELTDEHGSAVVATIRTYGDTLHSFVERKNYKGVFLPGFPARAANDDPIYRLSAPVGIKFVDHCVGNQPDNGMLPAVEFYEQVLQFHRFWSVDDKQIHTEFSALRSIVMTDWAERVKMPINEPAAGKKKSQIQEYVDYYNGAGVQHIALRTDDIIHSVTCLRQRGVSFLSVPPTYASISCLLSFVTSAK